MKILFKRLLYRFFYLIFLVSQLVTIEGCINECDVSNSSIVSLQFDSLKKAFPVRAEIIIDNVSYDSLIVKKEKLSTFFIPLNLEQDFTEVSIARGDSASYSFRLDYKRSLFSKGPDCGMDIQINNLSISEIKVNSLSKIVRTIDLLKTEVNLENTPNVKINF